MGFDYDAFGEAGPVIKANVVRLDAALASGLRPPPRLTVSQWAEKYRKFSDDAPLPGPWRHENAPYLVEIMDALSTHDPCEEVDIIKCSQSGGTAAIENWLGYVSDLAPGPLLFVQSTLKAALDWATEKFWPMVEASPRLGHRRDGTIKPLGAADGNGSNKYRFNFMRSSSFIALAGGNSGPSLRSRTMRYAVEDDLDQFPDDVDRQGSPEAMVDSRLKIYRNRGMSKRAKISTPTIKGSSKIAAAHALSDRREFYFVCPHCAARFRILWEPEADGQRDIHWPDGKPEEAYLVPRCCGATVEHWQKKAGMVRSDGWLSVEIDGEATPMHMDEATFQALRARMPLSRRRGFNIHGMLTYFQTWADMAVEYVDAQGDQNKLKGWTMLTLGAPFELRGTAPDHEKLRELKEQDWGYERAPVGVIATTQASDVQGDGIYTERVGWGPNAESWQLGARFIPGATDVEGEGAWRDLDAYSRRPVEFPGGKFFPIDHEMVDAGYNTKAVEAYCALRPNRTAVFGRAGWRLPVLGRGENLRYDQQGSRTGYASKKAEDKAYLVGVDGVKLTWYGYLRATLKAAQALAKGEQPDQTRGLVHLSKDTPDDWFEMVTAEAIVVETVNNWPVKKWRPLPGRQNHYLDCRVYNFAAAEKLMLDTLTEAEWAALRAERYAPRDPDQGDLLAMMTGVAPALPAPASTPPPASPDASFVDPAEDYL
ncbi:MAG: terminase [Brevundimonas sp.]|uniref:terminase gpA endonuclease subunit n=1 Tax=Brevundimonas sp. TaxID=1871086 RepID=UPI000DBBBFB6|nr:terminase gpA endonuclease subunit [Brevundimonas sp.]PZU62325.1 MAG: terminase [Brevundimonas sp.]